jgi:hypothetical protein
MKNFLTCLFFSLLAWGVSAQQSTATKPAQTATDKLSQFYGLDDKQQAEMLKIQEQKFRNLAEIEPIKHTDITLYIQKVRALQFGTEKSIERILTEDQHKLLRQRQISLREEKALAYKELKTADATQQEIDQKMMELDLKALE